MVRTLFALSVLLALGTPVLAHLSFNIAVDGEGNVYFLDVFAGRLMRVSAEGRVSELVDLWELAPGVRPHSLAMGARWRPLRRRPPRGADLARLARG